MCKSNKMISAETVKIVKFFLERHLWSHFLPAHRRLGRLVGRVNQILQLQIQQTVRLQRQKKAKTGWLLLHTPRSSVAVNAVSLLLLALLPAYVKGRHKVGGREEKEGALLIKSKPRLSLLFLSYHGAPRKSETTWLGDHFETGYQWREKRGVVGVQGQPAHAQSLPCPAQQRK